MKSRTARFVLTVSILLLGNLSPAAAASSSQRVFGARLINHPFVPSCPGGELLTIGPKSSSPAAERIGEVAPTPVGDGGVDRVMATTLNTSSPQRSCCIAPPPPDSNQFRIALLPSLVHDKRGMSSRRAERGEIPHVRSIPERGRSLTCVRDDRIKRFCRVLRLPSPPPGRPRHAVSFGVGYQPGPGLRLMGTYAFAGLPSGVLSLSAGWNERVFGAVSYTHLMDLHLEPRWRLLASTTLFSRYFPNRLLGGTATDERRTGASLRLELVGAYRFRRFQTFLAIERARVRLRRREAPDAAHWLTSVELGSQYTYARRTLLPEILLGARARVGWSETKGRFVALLGAARFYHPLGSRFGVLLDAWAQWVSPDAPLYEQASFGGMSSVRGYRAEAAVGRHLWVIQNELWVPVPGLTGPSTVGELVRRYVRLAAFFDIGGIAETAGAFDADVRTGLGVGLRLLVGPVTLRVDWGHRTAAVLDGHLQGNLYVSVRSSFALLAL